MADVSSEIVLENSSMDIKSGPTFTNVTLQHPKHPTGDGNYDIFQPDISSLTLERSSSNTDDLFQFNMSLQNLSAIAVAISFWERSDVKEKINKGFELHSVYNPDESDKKGTCHAVSSGQRVIIYIFKLLKSLHFPDKLLNRIKILIIQMGQRIYYWRNYVRFTFRLDPYCSENIYWTSYGQINELKIMQDWIQNPIFPENYACYCFLKNNLYCLVSKYAQEKYVERNVENMKNCIFPYLSERYRRQSWTPYALIATSIIFCAYKSESEGVKHLKNFQTAPDQLPAKDLVYICTEHCYEFAVKYFWDKLTLTERRAIVVENAETCLKKFFYVSHSSLFEKEKRAGTLLFFYNQMMETQKLEFISKNFVKIFKLFLDVSPYQELAEKFLNRMIDCVSVEYEPLLQYCMRFITGKEKSTYYVDKTFYHKLVRIILTKTPKTFKEKFFFEDNFKVFKDLYKTFDYDCLNLILNDDDLKSRKREISMMGLKNLKMAVLKGQQKDINKIIEHCNFSNEQKHNVLNMILNAGKVHLADEHLNWLFDSEIERNQVKNQVNSVEICSILIKSNKFDKVNEFLLWRFNAKVERKDVIRLLKSDEFLRNQIFRIWCANHFDKKSIDSITDKCSEFLNLFFESQEEIEDFKKNKIIEEDFIQKYWDALYYYKNFDYLDDFLKFCLFGIEDIKAKKANIANNIVSWIDTFAVEKGNFEMVDASLNWVYSNEIDKEKVVENYMSTPSGYQLCIAVFKNCKQKTPSYIKTFLNSWIKESFNFFEMKFQLDSCDFVVDGLIYSIKYLLKKKERNKNVTTEQIRYAIGAF